MSDESPMTSVDLSADLVADIEERVRVTDFSSTGEYVEYVLEEVLHHEGPVERAADVADESEVQERLESLGYLKD